MPSHLLVLPFFLLPLVAAAQDSATEPDPLFADDSVLEVRIKAPMRSIMTERPFENYVEGTFSYTEPDGREVSFDIGLRTRGRFRRREDICEFAPLRINFKKSQTRDTLFHKQDKLKLVTHCENRSPNYEQAVIAEYVAYRTFNLLTDMSFRARLLTVDYIDTDRDDRESQSYAILIEHRDRLAKRIGIPAVDVRMITIPQLDPDYAALAALFHYFLGNTDYSQIAAGPGESCCHNHELFSHDEQSFISIPYDFDMSGFVEAPHARPNSRFGLRSVRQRLYTGHCQYNDRVDEAVERFVANRDAIYDLIRSQEHLRPGKTRDQVRFVDSFFENVESPRDIERNL
ncbi:MAG: hypothetical protein R3315_13740, partial [Woeseiaceae bacterium]|nr:hypothetical protein [Woeseiaceae bacterium]